MKWIACTAFDPGSRSNDIKLQATLLDSTISITWEACLQRPSSPWSSRRSCLRRSAGATWTSVRSGCGAGAHLDHHVKRLTDLKSRNRMVTTCPANVMA